MIELKERHPISKELFKVYCNGSETGAWAAKKCVFSGSVFITGGVFYGGEFHRGEFHGGEFHKSPIAIQGTVHLIVKVEDDLLCVGCVKHPISYWLENYEQIGKENNYTPAEIEEYGRHIRYIAETFKTGEN